MYMLALGQYYYYIQSIETFFNKIVGKTIVMHQYFCPMSI